MQKVKFYLRDESIKRNAAEYLSKMPVKDDKPLMVTFSDAGRTLGQNAMFHALCGDLERSDLMWAGSKWNLEAWKAILVSAHAVATGEKGCVIAGIEGELVPIRESTASMGVARMNSLIEYSIAFATQNGVKLREVRYDNYTGNPMNG